MYILANQGLGQAPRTQSADIINIILIDPSGVFKNRESLLEQIRSKLEDKFNNLDPNWLRKANLRFKAYYRSNEPSSNEKAGFGKFDFPVYLLDVQHTSTFVRTLMSQHGIPKIVKGQDFYETVQKCWEARDTRGCGVPSGPGFRKVGFIKTHRVFRDGSRDLLQAFVNVIAHEVGHMGNRYNHSRDGLMKYPLPLNADIDFNTTDKYQFLTNLIRLKLLKTDASLNKPKIREFHWVFR